LGHLGVWFPLNPECMAGYEKVYRFLGTGGRLLTQLGGNIIYTSCESKKNWALLCLPFFWGGALVKSGERRCREDIPLYRGGVQPEEGDFGETLLGNVRYVLGGQQKTFGRKNFEHFGLRARVLLRVREGYAV